MPGVNADPLDPALLRMPGVIGQNEGRSKLIRSQIDLECGNQERKEVITVCSLIQYSHSRYSYCDMLTSPSLGVGFGYIASLLMNAY